MRRKHHKIATFPPAIRDLVNDLLSRGVTYEEIARRLRDEGHPVGRSSVARYGADFAARLERIKTVQEQLAAIRASCDDPMRMEDATTQISLQLIAEHLLKVQDLDASDPVKLIRAAAHLQSSSTARERLRAHLSERAKTAAERVEGQLRGQVAPEVLARIRTEILGLAS